MARDDSERYPPGRGKHTCKDEQYEGYWCEREPGHSGDHAALVASTDLDTVTWLNTNEVATPDYVAMTREEYARLTGFTPTETTPAPCTTVALTITSEAGEIARIERSVYVPDSEPSYAESVRFALKTVLRMGEGLA